MKWYAHVVKENYQLEEDIIMKIESTQHLNVDMWVITYEDRI